MGEDFFLALPDFFGDFLDGFLGEALLNFFVFFDFGCLDASEDESSSEELVEEAVEDVSLPSSEIYN